MDQHCFREVIRCIKSSPFSSGRISSLRQYAHGPYSAAQTREILDLFVHSSDKKEALSVIQNGLLPMTAHEAVRVMKSASFDKDKLEILQMIRRYITDAHTPHAHTEVKNAMTFPSDKTKAESILGGCAGGAYPGSGSPHHHHHHHHNDFVSEAEKFAVNAGKFAVGAGLAVGGALKGLFGGGNSSASTNSSNAPPSAYPSGQPAGSAYPSGQPAGSAYPSGQPAGSAYPAGYPGGSAYPAGSAYPGAPSAGYPQGNPGYPAGSAYPGSNPGYPQ